MLILQCFEVLMHVRWYMVPCINKLPPPNVVYITFGKACRLPVAC